MGAGDRIECFWVEPTNRGHRSLRRFSWGGDTATPTCEGGYHTASVQIDDDVEIKRTPEGFISEAMNAKVPHRDPRWPKTCAKCDYRFVAKDHWQVNHDEAWVRIDTGETVTYGLRDMPPGAMWDAFWMGTFYKNRSPDGIVLTVQLPGDTPWMVDGPSRNDGVAGPGWTRTGNPQAAPPTVSATPSILTDGYHGFLTDGALIEV